jgi:hypothetical protein
LNSTEVKRLCGEDTGLEEEDVAKAMPKLQEVGFGLPKQLF